MNAVYIHIPFCTTICSYCDFCKMHYNEELVSKYLLALNNEIKANYQGETIKTIYVGGGTPSCLKMPELDQLMDIIKLFNLDDNYEFTFECNIENVNHEKLELLYKSGVNRLSIGVQTFNPNLLTYLNRHHTEEEVINKLTLAKEIGFNNISIDLIYAIPGETIEDIESDLTKFLKLDINHIATYSLIIEPNTKLFIDHTKEIDDELDYNMYKLIMETLKNNGFNHYETSNFAKPGYESKHNLVYWDNKHYYGFGLGASGYINHTRYENTRSLNHYLEGKYILEEHLVEKQEDMENFMILGLRKINGVNKETFKNIFNIEIKDVFKIDKIIKEKKLLDDGNNLFIAEEYIYLANDILINFIGD